MQTLPSSHTARNGHAAPAVILQGPALVPEAMCSMNGFVKIGMAETRNHQVTGRGNTPEEAATNYFGCLDALEAGYAARAAQKSTPPPLAQRTARLAQLLVKGLACAATRQDQAILDRISKAAYLVLTDAVEPTEQPQAMAVRSQTHPDTWYTVEAGHCSCPDAGRHPERACKHRLAVELWCRLNAQEEGA